MAEREDDEPQVKRDQYADVKRRLIDWLDDEGEETSINPRVWDFLLDKPALLQSVRRYPETEIAKLYQEYSVALRHFGPRRARPRREVTVEGDARSQALSAIAAIAAERFVMGIDGFRERELGGRLLEAKQIPAWIEDQRRREGAPAAAYVRVPQARIERPLWMSAEERSARYADWLRQEAARIAGDEKAEVPALELVGPWTLNYGAPGSPQKRITIRGDGVLAELRSLVCETSTLHQHTGWSEAAGVAFVLGGSVPSRQLGVARSSFSPGAYPALSRIGLEVDPRLSAAEVGRLYQELRSDYMRGRDRPMDEKHLALAVFTEQTRASGKSWAALRTLWNKQHPKWRFVVGDDLHAKRFALECRMAWSRVTGEAWRSTQRNRTQRGPRTATAAPSRKHGGDRP